MSGAVLERDTRTFSLPGDTLALRVVSIDGQDWATAKWLADWLEVSERSVHRLALSLGESLLSSSRTHESATGGAVVGVREVTVYSEGAWRLFAEHGRKERARKVAKLFERWSASDARRYAAAAQAGPLHYLATVLEIAQERAGPVVEAAAKISAKAKDERLLDTCDLIADVGARLSESREFVAMHDQAALDEREREVRALFRAPRGPVDPDADRSASANTRAHNDRMKRGNS